MCAGLAGFGGTRCQDVTNACALRPCTGGQTCYSSGREHVCACAPGDICDSTPAPPPTDAPSPPLGPPSPPPETPSPATPPSELANQSQLASSPAQMLPGLPRGMTAQSAYRVCVHHAMHEPPLSAPDILICLSSINVQRVNITWIRSLDQDKDAWISEAEFEHGFSSPETVLPQCRDILSECQHWASTGECTKNPVYMQRKCQLSCFTQIVPAVCARASRSFSHPVRSAVDDASSAGACFGHSYVLLRRHLTSPLPYMLRLDRGCQWMYCCLLRNCSHGMLPAIPP